VFVQIKKSGSGLLVNRADLAKDSNHLFGAGAAGNISLVVYLQEERPVTRASGAIRATSSISALHLGQTKFLLYRRKTPFREERRRPCP
jgi:hypothetical protein